jgi:hypothetical protein
VVAQAGDGAGGARRRRDSAASPGDRLIWTVVVKLGVEIRVPAC